MPVLRRVIRCFLNWNSNLYSIYIIARPYSVWYYIWQLLFSHLKWSIQLVFDQGHVEMAWNIYVYRRVSLHARPYLESIRPKGPYPSCLRVADRALFAGYPRSMFLSLFWYCPSMLCLECTWWRHRMEKFSALLAPWCGEFTGHQWIPLTKASDSELWYFLLSVPVQTAE